MMVKPETFRSAFGIRIYTKTNEIVTPRRIILHHSGLAVVCAREDGTTTILNEKYVEDCYLYDDLSDEDIFALKMGAWP